MATLIVTFARIDGTHHYVAPVAQGSNVRTETITMPATGSLTVAAPEEIVELLPDADCWVAIGPTPDASVGTDGTAAARKLKADTAYTFHVSPGDKVAVEAA